MKNHSVRYFGLNLSLASLLENDVHSFSMLERINLMMDGHMRSKGTPMVREYIARDPRTGKPIQTSSTKVSEVSYQPLEGRWSALIPADIMSLAEGSLESREVRWMGVTYTLTRRDGIRALSSVSQNMIPIAHKFLLTAFEDEEDDIRIAALEVLPEFAVRRSDELFDWLSVLLDDASLSVRQAASEALARAAPTFPSGVRSSLENELRSDNRHRRSCAWKGLESLAKTWPDVVADHIDSLLLETEVELRRKAAKLLKTIISRKTSAVWDLVSWALNDEDAIVRRTAAKSLPKLANQDVRMATMFAERAIVDIDAEVRLSAIKTLKRLNRGHGRARDLIIAGARSNDIRVRQACIDLLPSMMSEDELRVLANDLLKTEKDPGLSKQLLEMRFEAALEGTEAQKNAALAPALAVPDLDKEVLRSQGKSVGLLAPQPDEKMQEETPSEPPAQAPPVSTIERRPTQDELMGYHDDEDEYDDMPDEEFY
jgi:HEAT repeat protein